MKLERHPSHLTIVGGRLAPPPCPAPETARDEALQELRNLWSDPVDLSKQPGLLYRLHAMLND